MFIAIHLITLQLHGFCLRVGLLAEFAKRNCDDLDEADGGGRYVKFDTFHPAVDIGLPVTRVISRVILQRKLAEKAEELEGKGVLCNDCHVVDYEEACFPATVPALYRAQRIAHKTDWSTDW